MIAFSCADFTFPLLGRTERFGLLKVLGFEYVDIGLFERSSDLRPRQLMANPKQFARELKRDLEHAGLRCADVFLQTGTEPEVAAANDPDPLVRGLTRKVFQRTVDLCASLECRHITGLPGVRHKEISRREDLDRALEEAEWRVQAAAGAGIAYAIEAHLGSLCSDVATTRAFVQAVPGLTLTLDYGHFIFSSVSSREIHSLLPLASHLHARGGAPDFLQVPVSENKIDFSGIMKRLQNRNYQGFVALEYVWTAWGGCNRTDNVSETILLRRLLEKMLTSGRRGKKRGREIALV